LAAGALTTSGGSQLVPPSIERVNSIRLVAPATKLVQVTNNAPLAASNRPATDDREDRFRCAAAPRSVLRS
jgi:hypothetical protein